MLADLEFLVPTHQRTKKKRLYCCNPCPLHFVLRNSTLTSYSSLTHSLFSHISFPTLPHPSPLIPHPITTPDEPFTFHRLLT
mmetsp:Transcript_19806/g.50661  ORF Transcript_19806/g.50661 Transcript_19806/m.50661 type:complete len:82 (+) Transcript_19806:1110-1355(+)